MGLQLFGGLAALEAETASMSMTTTRQGSCLASASADERTLVQQTYNTTDTYECPSAQTRRASSSGETAIYLHQRIRPPIRPHVTLSAHNPKVAGSNPAPATKEMPGQARSLGPGLRRSRAPVQHPYNTSRQRPSAWVPVGVRRSSSALVCSCGESTRLSDVKAGSTFVGHE